MKVDCKAKIHQGSFSHNSTKEWGLNRFISPDSTALIFSITIGFSTATACSNEFDFRLFELGRDIFSPTVPTSEGASKFKAVDVAAERAENVLVSLGPTVRGSSIFRAVDEAADSSEIFLVVLRPTSTDTHPTLLSNLVTIFFKASRLVFCWSTLLLAELAKEARDLF